ncbi:MAG: hypothetical protein QM775_09435 [Pirellulales bacterium]
MFWINPQYRPQLAKATLESYEAAAALRPSDDYVEKQGRSTGRYRIDVGGETLSLYVKKHFRLPWWRRMFGAAASFPGPQEQEYLEKAASLGIRVPETVFAGADPAHPCGSILATRELEGYMPLHIYIPGPLARMSATKRRLRKRALIGDGWSTWLAAYMTRSSTTATSTSAICFCATIRTVRKTSIWC